MPFSECTIVEQRKRLIEDWLSGRFKKCELAAAYGISRPTLDHWIARFKCEGEGGLKDRSRRPQSCPHRTGAEVEALLVKARKAHPTWGPKKLKASLELKDPTLTLPAASTIGDILERNGLVEPRPTRRKSGGPHRPTLVANVPNHVWCTDFKGEHKMLNGIYCYPLTITDAKTRYIFEIRGLPSTAMDGAKPVFVAVFEEYGLPDSLRFDGGVPFASPNGLRGLSQLSVWWLKLGITLQRIEPGRPDQNGRHERMHRTLKAETTRPPGANMAEQQALFDRFRREFNEERPHEALEQTPPAMHYTPSLRAYEPACGDFEYPLHWNVRRVSKAGHVKFKGHDFFLSYTLVRECVGLQEIDDGIWSVFAGNFLLGRFSEREGDFTPLQANLAHDVEEEM